MKFVDPAFWPKPFIKWAGGKTQLLDEILPRLPKQIDHYFEPFIGGGAVFFALASAHRFKRATIADANPRLIACYLAVRDDPAALSRCLKEMEREYRSAPVKSNERADIYYRVRGELNDFEAAQCLKVPSSCRALAARFIFLNRLCFNGLYRENSKGEFNVPHGTYAKPRICDEEGLQGASYALRDTEILCQDFAATMALAGPGSAVYADPPYLPLNATSSFSSYLGAGFGIDEHKALVAAIHQAARRGAHCLLSNSGAPLSVELSGAPFPNTGPWPSSLYYVPARRNVNCKGRARGLVYEILVETPPAGTAMGPLAQLQSIGVTDCDVVSKLHRNCASDCECKSVNHS